MTIAARRWTFGVSVTFALTCLPMLGLVSRARADPPGIDLEPPTYTTGNINGQDGWSGTGGIPNGGTYDYEVASTVPYGSPPGFATQSFRISNAVTSGSFGDWAFSKSLMDEAGEPGAVNEGFSGGTRQEHFEVSFDIVSAVPSAEQPGLQISVAPDRGDGARMSFLRFRDTPTGIAIDFADYRDNPPFGSSVDLADGCGPEDDFVTTTIATGLDRSVPHHIKLTMDFVTGPRNDVVTVYVDGQPFKCGTSWEDYYRYCPESQATAGPDVSRTVDSLLLQARSGSGTAPATLGFGFLVDNLDLLSGPSDCGQDCVCPAICGDGVVEAGEQCDPPGSITCPPGSPAGAFLACNQDCTCPTTTTTTTTSTTSTTVQTCGDGIVQPPEQCDPPGSSTCGAFVGGACGPNCQCPTTTTTVQATTSTTVIATTSTTVQATTSTTVASTTTTIAASTTTTTPVSTTTSTTQCSPTAENTSAACGDKIDNDCDGLVDCADPDCNGIFPCPPARKDPTIIVFGHAGSLDLIRGHAKLTMTPVDITTTPVGVLLSNPSGAIYSAELAAGLLTGDPNGAIFRFTNLNAKTAGGLYSVKIKRNRDGVSYTFSFRAYGDLSAATDAHMRLQFYVGNDPNAAQDGRVVITIDTPWTKTPHGWRAPKDH